jgi:hypothetical protein
MPLPGFLGFAPFALACWTIARSLVQVGLAPDWEMSRPPAAPPAGAPAKPALAAAVPAAPDASDAAGTSEEEADRVAPERGLGSAGKAADDEPDGDALGAEPPAGAESPRSGLSPGARLSMIAWAVLSCGLVLEAMDRLTVDSRTPRPEQVPGIPDGVAEYARRHGRTDVRGLLALVEEGRMHIPGESSVREVALLEERCRLVLLRGIGTDNARRLDAVGIRTIDELAAEQPRSLARKLRSAERGWWPRERRVTVWVDAARQAAAR